MTVEQDRELLRNYPNQLMEIAAWNVGNTCECIDLKEHELCNTTLKSIQVSEAFIDYIDSLLDAKARLTRFELENET